MQHSPHSGRVKCRNRAYQCYNYSSFILCELYKSFFLHITHLYGKMAFVKLYFINAELLWKFNMLFKLSSLTLKRVQMGRLHYILSIKTIEWIMRFLLHRSTLKIILLEKASHSNVYHHLSQFSFKIQLSGLIEFDQDCDIKMLLTQVISVHWTGCRPIIVHHLKRYGVILW